MGDVDFPARTFVVVCTEYRPESALETFTSIEGVERTYDRAQVVAEIFDREFEPDDLTESYRVDVFPLDMRDEVVAEVGEHDTAFAQKPDLDDALLLASGETIDDVDLSDV